MKGKRYRRGRDAGPEERGRQADRPGLARKEEDKVPLRNLSNSTDSRNGQLIRQGRSGRGRLHPVRANGPSGRRAPSGRVTWILLAVLFVLVGAAVWFLFLRDTDATGALLIPVACCGNRMASDSLRTGSRWARAGKRNSNETGKNDAIGTNVVDHNR